MNKYKVVYKELVNNYTIVRFRILSSKNEKEAYDILHTIPSLIEIVKVTKQL